MRAVVLGRTLKEVPQPIADEWIQHGMRPQATLSDTTFQRETSHVSEGEKRSTVDATQ